MISRVADAVHKWKMMDNHDQETNKEIATRSSSVAKLIAATSFLVEKEALFLSLLALQVRHRQLTRAMVNLAKKLATCHSVPEWIQQNQILM